jgi:S-adenosylmethionine hydrolase
MSVNPVLTIDLNVNGLSSDVTPQNRRTADQNVTPVQTDTGTSPKQEVSQVPLNSTSTELPQDKVQVQRDSETNGEVVIKYLDHFGNLIVQMPSSQMLGVTRAIDQDLKQEAKVRESEETSAAGKAGGNHGD